MFKVLLRAFDVCMLSIEIQRPKSKKYTYIDILQVSPVVFDTVWSSDSITLQIKEKKKFYSAKLVFEKD